MAYCVSFVGTLSIIIRFYIIVNTKKARCCVRVKVMFRNLNNIEPMNIDHESFCNNLYLYSTPSLKSVGPC
jgi:hypothetical protein